MEHDDWLELRGEEAKGQIHVKAQFIYSFQESCVQAIRILGQKIVSFIYNKKTYLKDSMIYLKKKKKKERRNC